MADVEFREMFFIVWKAAYVDNDPKAKAIIEEIEKDVEKERVAQ